MDKAVALYCMAANNYLLHLYYFSNKIKQRDSEQEKGQEEKMEQKKVKEEKMEQGIWIEEKMEQEIWVEANIKQETGIEVKIKQEKGEEEEQENGEEEEQEQGEEEKMEQGKGGKEKRRHVKSEKVKKRVKRRTWMISIHQNRTTHFLDDMLTELTADPERFFNFMCMSTFDFEILLEKLAPYITKKDTKFRRAIPAKIRLAMTLRYLSTGDNYRTLHYLFKISHQIISQIVPQVCAAIFTVLKDQLKAPVKEQDWLEKEEGFHDIFPHCVAAMDARGIALSTKQGLGDKKLLALLTLVDRNYCFIYADVGSKRKISDEDFQNSSLFQALENETLKLPPHSTLPDCSDAMPYVFVADNSVPLHTNIMNPYPGHHPVGSFEDIFNVHLSRARVVADNAFGVMSAVFQVLQRPFCLDPDRACNVVMACVVLHNFLMNSSTSKKLYNPPGYMDVISDGEIIPGSWRNDQQENGALQSLKTVAKESASGPMQIRNKFAEYFARHYS